MTLLVKSEEYIYKMIIHTMMCQVKIHFYKYKLHIEHHYYFKLICFSLQSNALNRFILLLLLSQ